jgi:hypothetical protein
LAILEVLKAGLTCREFRGDPNRSPRFTPLAPVPQGQRRASTRATKPRADLAERRAALGALVLPRHLDRCKIP